MRTPSTGPLRQSEPAHLHRRPTPEPTERLSNCLKLPGNQGAPGPSNPNGYGSKLIHQGTAGYSPCFLLSGFHFGYLVLTHTQIIGPSMLSRYLARIQPAPLSGRCHPPKTPSQAASPSAPGRKVRKRHKRLWVSQNSPLTPPPRNKMRGFLLVFPLGQLRERKKKSQQPSAISAAPHRKAACWRPNPPVPGLEAFLQPGILLRQGSLGPS